MTQTLTYTPGKFNWRECMTRDVPAAKRFYGELFGWTWEDIPMGEMTYVVWKSGTTQVGGLMDLRFMPDGSDDIPPNWSVNVSVEDVDAATAKAVAAGATVLADPMDVEGVCRFSTIQDPQGAVVGLMKFVDGDSPDAMPQVGEFCWEELATTSVPAAQAFYGQVFGWSALKIGEGDDPTTMLARSAPDDTIPVAIARQAEAGVPPHWMTYVSVASLDATMARAKELGGSIAVDRVDVPGVSAFCVLQAPDGAYLGAFEATHGREGLVQGDRDMRDV